MVKFSRLLEVQNQNIEAALCTIVETTGSTPRKPGSKMLVLSDGTIEGTVGGGAFEHAVRKKALSTLQDKTPCHFEIALGYDLGMCCGGTMSVFIEPIKADPSCLIFGAGHIGRALCQTIKPLGFSVHMADPRSNHIDPEQLPLANTIQNNYSPFELSNMPFSNNAYVLIATHDHQNDQALIEQILRLPFKYLGLIGSKRKALMTEKRCLAKGFAKDQISKIHCPAGLDINAKTPHDIALSVTAQMVQIKNA